MINRGLIVSCQAARAETLYGLGIMKHFAVAAVAGGAVAIRTSSVADILDIKYTVNVPVIGLIKAPYSGSEVYITPTLKEVKALLTTGCEVIAMDCTHRARPNGETLEQLVGYVREKAPRVELMADCADEEDAEIAAKLGFDYIATTMRGYTAYTKGIAIPDMDFIDKLVKKYPDKRVVAEGGVWEVGQAKAISKLNVYAITIGSAITRPKDITERFAEAIR